MKRAVAALIAGCTAALTGLQFLAPRGQLYPDLLVFIVPVLALVYANVSTRKDKEKPPAASPQMQLKQLSKQYGLPAVTPLQKSEALPLVTVPSVSAGGPWRPVRAELADEQETEPEYVPAGQADLSATLLEYVRGQVTEAKKSQWTAGRKREWHVSSEWLEEIRKLRTNGASGKLLWEPRKRQNAESLPGYLYGYPVVVGDHYGVPELIALLSL